MIHELIQDMPSATIWSFLNNNTNNLYINTSIFITYLATLLSFVTFKFSENVFCYFVFNFNLLEVSSYFGDHNIFPSKLYR